MTTHPTPPERDLVALLEMSDDDLCDLIEIDVMEVVRMIRSFATRAATVPQGVSVDALDAARLDWMVRNSARIIWSYGDTVCDVRWTPPDDVMRGNGGFSDWTPGTFTDWRTAIDAAMTPQQGG